MAEEKEKKVIHIEKKDDEIPVEDIKELLQMVNKELPALIKGLFASLYDAETAQQYAKGIATIYKELSEQGLPKEMIEKLVMKYSDSINIIGSAMKNIKIDKEKEVTD
ncbi:MAG: hypothetical protein K9W42_07440 [Candidatus Heimdallarchaeota archaeon]|nr:hypothetical protein [Candidatus Heimdallarchaeota archaeon]